MVTRSRFPNSLVPPQTLHDLRSPYAVAIVGGGIAGCALARELSRYALSVCLLEKAADVGFGTSKANSGIIHGGHHASPTTLKGRLEWEGNRRWDPLCAELDFGFRRCGELTVALTPDELPILAELVAHGAAKGVPGLELWSQEQLRAAEPNLSPEILAAVHAPTTGVVNPYEACFRLAESAARNGVAFFTECAVTGLADDDTGWTLTTTRGPVRARFVINAAGLYADAVAELAGVRTFTIHPRKGEEYLLDKRLQGLVKHVIFPCPTPLSKGILVIPTFDGTLMVGPTAQPVAEKDDLRTTPAGSAEIFAAVQRLVPGISARDTIAEFAGVRAAADGEDFIIGPTAKRGFINVAGIQSPGLTAAPAIAALVADLLAQEGLAMALHDDFVPTLPPQPHFAALSDAAQMELARADPAFGRIVCRCETVTEGEIVAAIRRGATTLDGLKFRTRAGMGRCQGGFCTARCLQVLSRELGVPLCDLTKRGDGSWLVVDRDALALPGPDAALPEPAPEEVRS